MELKLHSPVGFEPAVYYWPLLNKKGYNVAAELIETMKWACQDLPDLQIPLKKNILQNYDINNYQSMKSLCRKFNKAIDSVLSLEKGTQKFCDRLNQIASKDLLRHILQQTYSSAIENAEELNKYEAFSPDVYGETSFDLVLQIIKQAGITKEDIFIDLGSGVGQVVLQVAALTDCKNCIGIEKAEVPSKYAEAMQKKFNFWMNWYGKKFGKYELIRGDFLDKIYHKTINTATIVFINNYAFGPALDHKLKERFAEFKDGTKIISCKSFCSINFRITDRNLSDIGTIMNISQLESIHGEVSWTGRPISFYIQVIDRSKLERYFQRKMKQKLEGRSEQRISDVSNDISEDEGVCPKSKSGKLRGRPRKTNQSKLDENEQTKSAKVPAELQRLLDLFKCQYIEMLDNMQTPLFKLNIENQIRDEIRRNEYLIQKSRDLENEIDSIIQNMKNHVC